MRSANPENEQWNDCPTGQLGNLVSRLRGQRRQRVIIRNTVIAGVVCLVFAVGFSVQGMLPFGENGQYADLLQGDGPIYGKISCQKVKHYGEEYMAGDIDPEIKKRIDNHLKECHNCRLRYAEMRQAMQKVGLLLPMRNVVQLQNFRFLIANALLSN